MMFAQTRLLVLLGLGALMTPTLAANPTTTVPTCGDPQPSVECSINGKDWKCPPNYICGLESPVCDMGFEACTPSAESTNPPKTTATSSTSTKSDPAAITSSGTGTATSSAPTNSSTGNAAAGLGVGSWTAAVMGLVAGGLVM